MFSGIKIAPRNMKNSKAMSIKTAQNVGPVNEVTRGSVVGKGEEAEIFYLRYI